MIKEFSLLLGVLDLESNSKVEILGKFMNLDN